MLFKQYSTCSGLIRRIEGDRKQRLGVARPVEKDPLRDGSEIHVLKISKEVRINRFEVKL